MTKTEYLVLLLEVNLTNIKNIRACDTMVKMSLGKRLGENYFKKKFPA